MLPAIGVGYMVHTSSQRDHVVLNYPPRRRRSSTFLVRLVGERQHAKGVRMANNNDEKEALDEFLRKELAGVELEGARFEWTDVSIVHATKEAEPTED